MNQEMKMKREGVREHRSKPENKGPEPHLAWDKYREIYDLAPIAYFIINGDTTILDVNTRGAILLNATREKLLGTKLKDFVTTPFENILSICKTSILETEERPECELEMVRADHSRFFSLLQGCQLGAKELVIFVTDITKHKLIENALKESEQRYREVADRLAEGIFEADTSGTVTYANHKVLSFLGLSEDDLKRGLKVFDVIAPQSLALARERLSKVLRQEDVGTGEYLLVRRDGTTFPALVHSLAIVREGKVTGVRGILIDISERKKAETALQDSERKYRELAELLGAGIFEADATGALTYSNLKGLTTFGLDENDLKNGLNVSDVVAPRDLNVARENFARVLKQEDVGPAEYLVRRKDGTVFPVLTHSSAIMREGVVVGIRGIVVDISELKRTEQALKESERKYRELTDLLDEGVFELDLNGKFTYVNRKGLSFLGIDENDLNNNGLTVFDVVAPKDLELAKERLALALNREDTGVVEFLIMRKDGTTFPAVTHASAIVRDDVVVGVRGIVFDISDLKKTEQALRESEQRFRTLLKSLHEGIWVLDKDDMTTFVNPRMAEMLGYTEEEILGKPVFAFSDEDWKKKTDYYMDRRKQGISEQLECEFLRKDGGRVYALLAASPILDEDGNYVGSIAGVQDITERKFGEEKLKQTMAELDRSNKELEQFAYVTSHDLREPLRMMTSFAQSLEKRYKSKLDKTADEYIHFIVDGSARMQRLIDDILTYSRVSTRGLPFEKVDMETILQEVLLNLRVATEETKARITRDTLPFIQADPSQMKQVLQNLIGNAIKFHREEEPPVVHISANQEGKEWIFSVKDNGIGMDPELFGRLFNLFQRLHPPDKYPGTGVGLAVAKKIVQRHGGRIWVESQPEKGSTFHFSVPLTTKVGPDGRE